MKTLDLPERVIACLDMRSFTLAARRLTQDLIQWKRILLSLSISNLEEESSMQLSLFEARKWENRKLGAALDNIRNRYGYAAIYRAVSGTEAGTTIARTHLIGGHKK